MNPAWPSGSGLRTAWAGLQLLGRGLGKRGCGERRRVKDESGKGLWPVLSFAGGVAEPARGWENRPGSRSETWWGQGIKSPIVLGKFAEA